MQDQKVSTHIILSCLIILDKNEISCVGRKIYPQDTNYFNEAYHDAISSQPHGCLIVDLKPNTDNSARLRTTDFSGDNCFVYTKK